MAAHNITHGMTGTPTYKVWLRMHQRCRRPHYKAKGITVDPSWCGSNGFMQFLADMGEYQHGMTLDRIDNDSGYKPGNCRWATPRQQARNRGDNLYVICDGVRMALTDAIEAKGWPTRKVQSFVWYAMKYKGVSADEAFQQFGPKRSWVEYKGTMMPIGRACKLAGLRWRPNIDRKAQLEGISLQAAFDHFLSK